MEEVIKNLIDKGFDAYYVKTKDEVYPLLTSLLDKNGLISHGGSKTLDELNILDKLVEDGYNLNDRRRAVDKKECMLKAFSSKYYLASSNAIARTGEIVNIDGTGNRVAAITYGPEQVILIVGKNKITNSVSEAIKRARCVAAPLNAKRLLGSSDETAYDDSEKLCVTYVVQEKCRIKGRIKVILVNEDLGY